MSDHTQSDDKQNKQDNASIDPADLSQASPAEAEAEVSDPDGRDTDEELDVEPAAGVIGLGVIVGTAGNLGSR